MKILLSAMACRPNHGSEPMVGWNAVNALAANHEIWVLTDRSNEPMISGAQREGGSPENVHFKYFGRPYRMQGNPTLARTEQWDNYRVWCSEAAKVAKELHRSVCFDVIHHVTIATWRVPVPLDDVGPPFVWGPLGGGEKIPQSFLGGFNPMANFFEHAREIATGIASRWKGLQRCARSAAHIIAANDATLQLLSGLTQDKSKISKLLQVCFSADEIKLLRSAKKSRASSPIRMFAGGTVEARKGIALALAALSRVRDAGVDFLYTIAGDGPEKEHLQRLVRKYKLDRHVRFVSRLARADYLAELAETEICLLPSLRDSAGITLMEAMLAGCVPVVLGLGGPAEIVDSSNGIKLPATTPEEGILGIGNAILRLVTDPEKLDALGRNASAHVAANYSFGKYRAEIEKVYERVTKLARPNSCF
jgi:glycosyltransferase involved in cell wall biosynthesis